MSLTLSNRLLTGWPAVALIAALAAGSSAVSAPGRGHAVPATAGRAFSHAAAVTASQQRAVTGYWTTARMRRAIRDAWSDGNTFGAGLRWVHGGAITRTTGKVFFTLNGKDYACSGSVVDSPARDVVLTAAHCTGGRPGHWASNWTFVPGYADGAEPYGTYTARRFYVSPQWAEQRDNSSARSEKYDVAFVTVNPAGHASSGSGTVAAVAGRRLGDVTGGQRLSFSGGDALKGQAAYVFGYPSDPPFTGLFPDYCAGLPRRTPGDITDGAMSLPCAMTAGDSGGPWLTGFSPQAGTGTIVGVSTYKYGSGAALLYGTVLGPAAERVYEAASSAGAGRPAPARASRVRRSGGPSQSRPRSGRRPSA